MIHQNLNMMKVSFKITLGTTIIISSVDWQTLKILLRKEKSLIKLEDGIRKFKKIRIKLVKKMIKESKVEIKFQLK